MQGFMKSRRLVFGAVTIVVMLTAIVGTTFLMRAQAAPIKSGAPYVAIDRGYAPLHAKLLGNHAGASKMTIEVALAPSNAAQLSSELSAIYNPKSPQFHHFLKPGEFNKQFAPSAAEQASVQAFLTKQGFTILSSSNPFLVRAAASTNQVQSAFRTHINDYQASNGTRFFSNSQGVFIPAELKPFITGVVGLSNTSHAHPDYLTQLQTQLGKISKSPVPISTRPHYGGGPGPLGGLTPAQLDSMYHNTLGAQIGDNGKGKGTTLAVFELSGYTATDANAYASQFGLPNMTLEEHDVDGGPINPICPQGDQCVAAPDYSGDIEVMLDIEVQLAMAPKATKIEVYNAPNDYYGFTELDEYYQIANDDSADSISTSWGICEQDAGFGQAEAEYGAFKQMALQGQSIFSAAGDSGAYDCYRDDGVTTALSVDDPSSQPYMTSVGGTTFLGADPGTNKSPAYPGEQTWNPTDPTNGKCSPTNIPQCANGGAGGGGNSVFWGPAGYQNGAGVINAQTAYGPTCQQQSAGLPCREVPDVSADADPNTGYAVYCTGDPNTNSTCGSINKNYGLQWLPVGGTSAAAPLWAGFIADYNSYHKNVRGLSFYRFGWGGDGLYTLFHTTHAYTGSYSYFHDVTQNDNGFYNALPNYDMATGIGTPNMYWIEVSNPGVYNH